MEKAFTDSTPMPFGKFRGKPMIDVPAPYLLWLFDNGCTHDGVRKYIIDNLDGVRKYIIDNLDALKKEAGQTVRR